MMKIFKKRSFLLLVLVIFISHDVVVNGQTVNENKLVADKEALISFKKAALSRGEAAPINREQLSGLILPAQSHFKVDPSYVSRHDVVYLSPEFGPFEGLPMGNGDLGGMIWTTDEGIGVQINKSNTFDWVPNRFALQSVGRMNIRFGTPCFEWLQLDDFEGRLSLVDGTVRYKASTQYMETNVEAITCADRNAWMITLEANLADQFLDSLNMSVDLDRYGSRTLARFFDGMERNNSDFLSDTEIAIRGKDIVLTDHLKDINVVTAMRILGAESKPRILNNRRGTLEFKMLSKQKVTILCAVVTSEEAENPLNKTKEILDGISLEGEQNIKATHALWWKDFWNRSFVHIDDDYVENLYHIRRYLMAAGSRGNYPILFNAGLWLWNRDVRNWNMMTHWNQLNTYVGLQAQNDCDLLLPHLDLYWRLTPDSERDAKEEGIDNAILVAEAQDARGKTKVHRTSFTVGPHIARFYLKQYEFTNDLEFLKDYAYPFAKKAGEFYVQYLKWDEQANSYTIYPARPYECGYGNKEPHGNTVTDISMIRYLFPKLIEYSKLLNVDENKRSKWQHILDHLWEPPILDWPGKGEVYGEVFDKQGNVWPGAEYIKSTESNYYSRIFHFSASTAFSFPGDFVDIDDKGTREYELINRFLEIHPDKKNAISMDPIVAARLGNDKELLRFFRNAIQFNQHFPQGFFYNMDYQAQRSARYDLDKEGEAKFVRDYIYYEAMLNAKNRRRPFAQAGMEPMCIQAAAVNEMLLQSHDGKIRVFPATPHEWEAAFILRASGGFMVSSSKEKNQDPDHVMVNSSFGSPFKMVNPWNSKELAVYNADNKKKVSFKLKDGIIQFDTKEKGSYIIKKTTTEINNKVFTSEPNQGPKYSENATIGKSHDFNNGRQYRNE